MLVVKDMMPYTITGKPHMVFGIGRAIHDSVHDGTCDHYLHALHGALCWCGHRDLQQLERIDCWQSRLVKNST